VRQWSSTGRPSAASRSLPQRHKRGPGTHHRAKGPRTRRKQGLPHFCRRVTPAHARSLVTAERKDREEEGGGGEGRVARMGLCGARATAHTQTDCPCAACMSTQPPTPGGAPCDAATRARCHGKTPSNRPAAHRAELIARLPLWCVVRAGRNCRGCVVCAARARRAGWRTGGGGIPVSAKRRVVGWGGRG
jgi:hypothetical protein